MTFVLLTNNFSHLTDAASNKLQGSNIFTIAKRTVDGQDMLYQSVKLTNGIWVLAELRMQTGNPNYTVSGIERRSGHEETSKVMLERAHVHADQ